MWTVGGALVFIASYFTGPMRWLGEWVDRLLQ